jgi:hypothetical protein
MDEQTLAEETIRARENGDEKRLNELARAERMGTLSELDGPKYAEADSDSGDSSGAAAITEAADRAVDVALAGGDSELASSFRSIARADDPQQVLNEELEREKDRGNEHAVDALNSLRG